MDVETEIVELAAQGAQLSLAGSKAVASELLAARLKLKAQNLREKQLLFTLSVIAKKNPDAPVNQHTDFCMVDELRDAALLAEQALKA